MRANHGAPENKSDRALSSRSITACLCFQYRSELRAKARQSLTHWLRMWSGFSGGSDSGGAMDYG